ncbi:hypothetical protein HDU98_009056 [Podochytrium sp. JEL0797]|nr:hypothetical protein HDU98_009056 [Podochytrium sp. JEL0797]
MVCNKTPLLWSKQYSFCTTDVPALQTIYPGLNTVAIDRDSNGTALGTLFHDGVEQFMCQMNGCNQTILSSGDFQYEYSCAATQCACAGQSTFCGGPGVVIDLTKTIGGASGTFKFSCKTANSTICNVYFGFLEGLFPQGLALPTCSFGECAYPSQNPALTASLSGPVALTAGQWAAVVVSSIAFLTLAALFVWALKFHFHATRLPPPPPLKGLTLSFSKMGYTLNSGKPILRNVSGIAPAGQILAILGPSGAGKSTFLDILGGKNKTGGEVVGDIQIDGVSVDTETLSSVVGFVDQSDLLMPHLTVRETLMFSACLRLPESVGYWNKVERVNEVVRMLGLTHIADSKCGGFGMRGISGGERRRVSIGVELVTSPAVLCLDEPTSGLDSHAAHSLIENLALLAHTEGKTIIFTIHQPRSDIFSLFDRLLVLSAGSVLYSGAAHQTLSKFLHARGEPCPDRYNMADHLLDLAAKVNKNVQPDVDDFKLHESSGGVAKTLLNFNPLEKLNPFHKTIKTLENRIELLETKLKANVINDPFNDDVQHLIQAAKFSNTVDGGFANHAFCKIGFITQVKVLMDRSFKILVRTPSLLLAHFVLAVVMGCFVGGVYFDSGVSIAGIQNRLGSVLFTLSLVGFSSLSAIGSFATERDLFLRERSNKMYSPMSFYLCKILFDTIPLRIFPTMLMGTISFFMIGYTHSSTTIARFLAMLVTFSAEMGLMCLFFGVAISDVGTSTLTGAIVILFQMLFAGALINDASLPVAMSWVQYLSFFRYAYEGLCVNDLATVNIIDVFDGVNVNFPAGLILAKFGFNVNNYMSDFIASLVITLLLLFLTGFWIQFRLQEKR